MNQTNVSIEPCSKVENRAGCLSSALDIIGDKWSALLLGQLIDEKRTFSQLEKSLVGISPRTLSARLDKLTDHNILKKEIYCEHPPRFRYCLTEKGSELQDILRAMGEWGDKHHF